MAIKPNDGEVFLREVDEELRKERMNTIVRRYGWAIVAGFVLLLGAIGGYFWWQARSEAQAGDQGEALVSAMQSLEAGNRNAAMPKIDELANSDIDGYRAAALFAPANVQLAANNNAAAIATLRAIADDEGLAEPYRHAALVRQTALEFDSLQPQQVIQRLRPLARPGQAWFGSAGEMVGIAHLRMNRPDLAGPLFGQIGRDETVPPSIRTRAIQMAGALGVDALPQNETSRGQPDEAGNPPADGNQAATREKAQ
ncbi:MAG: tetratricopeptide repeat protein [Sphingosinicella sp.]|uniref:tetratricopeptide repeat protein n=1 Tax=Sphingosinicella sp. TaxID=1917971 RepID=UPI0040383B9D